MPRMHFPATGRTIDLPTYAVRVHEIAGWEHVPDDFDFDAAFDDAVAEVDDPTTEAQSPEPEEA